MTKAKFYWIISATLPYDDVGFSNRSLYNNAICTIMSGVKQKYVIVKNTDEELSQSYQQSEITYYKYMCFNRNFNIFGERVSNEIQRMIAADDIAGAIVAGTAMTTGTISLGGTAQTGTITLGSSSGTNTVTIAGGSGASTVNIANVQVAGAVSVGNGMTTGTITVGGTNFQLTLDGKVV
jgi:hypothetical protein